jgi:hypothetical protein
MPLPKENLIVPLFANFIVGLSAGVLCSVWLNHCCARSYWVEGCAMGLLSFSFYSFYHFRKFNFLPISVSFFLGICFFIFQIKPKNLVFWQWFAALSIVALSLFYVFPAKKSLRDSPFLKAPIIALVWIFILFIFPLWNRGISTQTYQIEIIAFGLLYFGLTIPFDVRDYKKDSSALRTLPQLIGVHSAQLIASLLIASFSWLMYYTTHSFGWIVFAAIAICLVLLANERRKKSYFILIDSLVLLAAIVLYLT